MRKINAKDFFRRSMVVLTALLISNVAALSCALAFSLCDDCPEPPPVHCVDLCEIADNTVGDSAPDGSVNPGYSVLPQLPISHDYIAVTDDANKPHRYGLQHPSPPLNLLNCVFLK